eukprot:402422_1
MRRGSKNWRRKGGLKSKLLINNFNGFITSDIINIGAPLYPHNVGLLGNYYINPCKPNPETYFGIINKTHWDEYRSNCKQMGRKLKQLEFLDICRNNNNTIPRGFRVKTNVNGIKRNRDKYIHNIMVNRFETSATKLRRSILRREIRILYKDTLPMNWNNIKHLFRNNYYTEELLISLNCAIATTALEKEKIESNKLLDL